MGLLSYFGGSGEHSLLDKRKDYWDSEFPFLQLLLSPKVTIETPKLSLRTAHWEHWNHRAVTLFLLHLISGIICLHRVLELHPNILNQNLVVCVSIKHYVWLVKFIINIDLEQRHIFENRLKRQIVENFCIRLRGSISRRVCGELLPDARLSYCIWEFTGQVPRTSF